jgi:hypothetical protein
MINYLCQTIFLRQRIKIDAQTTVVICTKEHFVIAGESEIFSELGQADT